MKRIVCILLLLVAMGATQSRSCAQFNPSPIAYIMPTGVDPLFLDFTFDGQQYTVSGLQLLPSTYNSGGDGVEFRVPHSDNTGIVFNRFEITTDYVGGFSLTSSSMPGFTPWGVTQPTGASAVVFALPGSALVGEPVGPDRYFAHFGGTSDSFTGIDTFATSSFVIRGFAIPEPGAPSALAAALAAACALVLKRRKLRS